MTNHHTFVPPRLTRGQQILVAKPVKMTPAAEKARRLAQAKIGNQSARSRGWKRGGAR